MDIIKIEKFDEKELINRLRKVTMLKDRNKFPYKDSYISVERLSVQDMVSPQRYVLNSQLKRIRELKWALEEHGIDIFNLDGFVRFYLRDNPEPIDILPAIVEETIEQNGRLAPLINDGMHRVYVSYLQWTIPRIVYIRGIPRDLPYYAFPIPDNDWNKIEILDDIPKSFIKKWHRIDDNKLLYRDFNASFKNVGGPRGTGSFR